MSSCNNGERRKQTKIFKTLVSLGSVISKVKNTEN